MPPRLIHPIVRHVVVRTLSNAEQDAGHPSSTTRGRAPLLCLVTAGTGRNLFFRETDRPIQAYGQYHIQIYINDFSGRHRRLAAKEN
jgi:hypothetical protein